MENYYWINIQAWTGVKDNNRRGSVRQDELMINKHLWVADEWNQDKGTRNISLTLASMKHIRVIYPDHC